MLGILNKKVIFGDFRRDEKAVLQKKGPNSHSQLATLFLETKSR